MSKHSEFILTPITVLLEEFILIASAIDWNMKSFSITEYMLHSLFLKMTGAQEQKFKCLVWEIGTEDLKYRRENIYEKWEYGECSTLEAKNKIFKKLYENIKKNQWNREHKLIKDDVRSNIYNHAKQSIIDLYEKTIKYSAYPREYNDFIDVWGKLLSNDTFLIEENNDLVPVKKRENISKTKGDLILFKDAYENLYDNRNLCAHNFKVSQTNCYDLSKMRKNENITNNYFFFFALLIVIDSFVILLYKYFINEINQY